MAQRKQWALHIYYTLNSQGRDNPADKQLRIYLSASRRVDLMWL